jgi:hypothetical protein
VILIERWLSSINHADIADWITVAAYLLSAFISAQAAALAKLSRRTGEARFWQATAMLLVALGANELLDLQTLLTEIVRAQAKASGWYGEHRKVQYAFVISLAAMSLLAGSGLLWVMRRTAFPVRLALVGLIFIGAFVLLRAASFHHLDDLLGRGPAKFNWGSLQELAGILIVASGGALYCRKRHGRAEPGQPPAGRVGGS